MFPLILPLTVLHVRHRGWSFCSKEVYVNCISRERERETTSHKHPNAMFAGLIPPRNEELGSRQAPRAPHFGVPVFGGLRQLFSFLSLSVNIMGTPSRAD